MSREFDETPNPLLPPLRPETPVEDLDLSPRVLNRICKVGVRTLHELALVDPATLLNLKGFGRKSRNQVARVLEDYFGALPDPDLGVYSKSLPLWRPYFSKPQEFRPPPVADRIQSQISPFRAPPRPETPIECLDLSVRALNRIFKLGAKTLHALALLDPAKLLRLTGFGRKSTNEVASVLEDYFHRLANSELAAYSRTLPLWRPYFSNPEEFPPSLRSEEAQSQPVELRREIEQLPLSSRAVDCLTRAGVNNLHELASRFPTEIRHFSYFGNKVLIELAHHLQAYFESLGPMPWSIYPRTYNAWLRYAGKPFVGDAAKSLLPESSGERTPLLSSNLYGKTYDTLQRYIRKPYASAPLGALPAKALAGTRPPLLDIVKGFHADQKPRNAEIILRRFGLASGGRTQTLVAIGRRFGLTRERIRQIASTGKRQFAKMVRRSRPDLVPCINNYLQKARLATIAEITSKIPDVGCAGEFHAETCVRLVLEEHSPQVHPIDPAAQLWTSCAPITPAFYAKVLTAAKEVLHGIPVKLGELVLETARRIGCIEDSDIETIERMVRGSPLAFTVESEGQVELVLPVRQNLSGQRKTFAYNYIKEQGIPIRISEIFAAMQEMEPALVPDSPTSQSAMQTIKSLLGRDERFAWAGLSTFGLREWGYDPGVTSIGEAAVRLLRAAGKTLTISEITDVLTKLYRVKPNSINAALNIEKGKTIGKDSEGRWFALR